MEVDKSNVGLQPSLMLADKTNGSSQPSLMIVDKAKCWSAAITDGCEPKIGFENGNCKNVHFGEKMGNGQ